MKLEVGMYVRTKDGISKIENISPNEYDKEHDYIELENFVFDGLDTQAFFTTDKILKASHTLLGNNEEPCLIEVGDYVNADRVTQVTSRYVEVCYGRDSFDFINEEEIKSIVTKEQFESMKYSLEG